MVSAVLERWYLRRARRPGTAVMVGASLLIGGCAAVDPVGRLPAGSSTDQVTRSLGTPTAVHPLSAPAADLPGMMVDATGRGVRRLEYGGGSYGRTTYMFDVDAQGRVLAGAQVRTRARFDAIRPGMDRQQVLRTVGHPSTVWPLALQSQMVWSYRFETPFCEWFQIGMGHDGRVVDASYGPDPLCQVDLD